MKVIVGLGNPGLKYKKTRHNVGFETMNRLAKTLSLTMKKRKKFNARCGIKTIHEEQIIICKPLTYMNLSGDAVKSLLDYYKLSHEQLLVVYDDLDLPPGKIRLREKGSAGGHNGMKSIIQKLGTEHFKRIRIGIGQPQQGMDVTAYVLGKFTPSERRLLDDSVTKASRACEMWLTTPFPEVMNQYNNG